MGVTMVVGCAGGVSERDGADRPGTCFTSEDDDCMGNPSISIPWGDGGRWAMGGTVTEGIWMVDGVGGAVDRGSILNSNCGGCFDVAGVLTLLELWKK